MSEVCVLICFFFIELFSARFCQNVAFFQTLSSEYSVLA